MLWAIRTFGGVKLGDARLEQRLVCLAATLAAKPGCSIPQACANPAAAKATYRFLENERVSYEPLVAAAARNTAKACAGLKVILAVQDTTTISLPGCKQTQGLGPVGEEDGVQGLLVHSTIALRDDGQPLGLLHVQIWARDPVQHGQAAQRKERPFEDKESYKWVVGLTATRACLQQQLPPAQRPRVIHLTDREGDIHEVFAALEGTLDGAVIRSAQNRRVDGPSQYAHQTVRAAPLLGCVEVETPRTAKSAARQTRVEVRAGRVNLAPDTQKHPERQPLPLTLVEVWEPAAPEGTEPLHWLLWTTESVTTLPEAMRVVSWYRLRWRIEDVHLVLKEGCRVEKLQLETAERLAEALVVFLAIALRLVALRDGARLTPQAPCTSVLQEDEWRTLWVQRHKCVASPGQAPPTLREAVLWIGRMGGHQGRKGDGMPGVKALWRGWHDLMLLAEFYVGVRGNA